MTLKSSSQVTMEPRIEIAEPKKLVGQRMKMSFSDNKTHELWYGFMSRKKEIRNSAGQVLFSLQIYPPGFFSNFNPDTQFEKWAAIEAEDFNDVPDEMEAFTLQGGMYAVFLHKGPASDGPRTFQYIFGTWLPASDYKLDDRPHFELLGDKYKNDDPESEEEIWIPVKPKKF